MSDESIMQLFGEIFQVCQFMDRIYRQNIYHENIQGEAIAYDGDPLQDFTLQRFLDRFVFRNPKAVKENRRNAEGGEICPLRVDWRNNLHFLDDDDS